MVAIVCLCVALAVLFATSRENELPDIEDVKESETLPFTLKNWSQTIITILPRNLQLYILYICSYVWPKF